MFSAHFFSCRLCHLLVVLAVIIMSYGTSAPAAAAPAITTVSPASGVVGALIAVSGTIDTAGGALSILWDGSVIATGSASSGSTGFNSSFNVPAAYGGNHNVTVRDNTTSSVSAAATFMVTATMTVTPTSGLVGTSLTVTGAGFTAGETGINVTYDGTAVKSGLNADAVGNWSTTFVIPDSASGVNHIVDSFGATTLATAVTDVTVTVTPSITVTPASGNVGTTVTITGSGFQASESGISVTIDGEAVKTGLAAGAQGNWTTTAVLPDTPSGNRVIDAFGAATLASAVADRPFTVIPQITISPNAGTTGSAVTVNGTGFGANEIGIVVTLGPNVVTQGIAASNKGRWTASFTIPAGAGGTYNVSANGSATASAVIAPVAFTIAARLTTTPLSGVVGTEVTATGASFGTNEGGIRVLYDGVAVATVNASASGEWKTSFKVPASGAGPHKITAVGAFTQNATEQSFAVTQELTITPVSGYVDTVVTVSGTGFTAGRTVTIMYDDKAAATTPAAVSTSPQGSFSASFKAPPSKGGPHKIRINDGAIQKEADWAMDSTAPPVPSPLNPTDGQVIGWFGGDKVNLKWSTVDDPSGVSYSLEMDADPKFPSPQYRMDNLEKPEFATGEMPFGTYYWRVKAADRASNVSSWSPVWSVKVGIIPMWVFITICVVLVVIVGAVVFLMTRRRSSGW